MKRLAKKIQSIVNNTKDAMAGIQSNPIPSFSYLTGILISLISIATGVVGFIRFIVGGGYTAQVNATREYGIFAGYAEKFTRGSAGDIYSGIIGVLVLILAIAGFVFLLILFLKSSKMAQRLIMIVDVTLFSILVIFAFIFRYTVLPEIKKVNASREAAYAIINEYYGINIDIGKALIVYAITLLITFVTLLVLVLTSKIRIVFINQVKFLLFSLIILPLFLWIMENIITLITGIIAIIIVYLIGNFAFSALTADKEGGGSTSSKSASHSEPKPSEKDNKSPSEKDTNPNHIYIKGFNKSLKLYRTHDFGGTEIIESDNGFLRHNFCTVTEVKRGTKKFYRQEDGTEIRLEEIPWQSD